MLTVLDLISFQFFRQHLILFSPKNCKIFVTAHKLDVCAYFKIKTKLEIIKTDFVVILPGCLCTFCVGIVLVGS